MSDTAKAAASPLTITLGDKTFTVSPLTDRDIGEFERWLQFTYIDAIRSNLDGLKDDERAAILKDAYRELPMLTMGHPYGVRIMGSLRGITRMFWLSLRKCSPHVTEDEVFAIMSAPALQDKAQEALRIVNDVGADEVSLPGESPDPKDEAAPVQPESILIAL